MSLHGSEAIDAGTRERLLEAADEADGALTWPARSWQALAEAGVLAWAIPPQHGGRDWTGPELLAGYRDLAATCLTSAFILSQREAAIRRLCAAPTPALHERFLPDLARGRTYASVGLAQLTTSRQHQAPALRASAIGLADNPEKYVLDGLIPWVTGADQARFLVIGAPLPDNRQVLLALPTDQAGVTVEPPLPLMALAGSRTSQVRCQGVELGREWLLAGPAEKIMTKGGSTVGGVETSCLALGLARAAIGFLHQEGTARPDVAELARRFENAHQQAWENLITLAGLAAEPQALLTLRVTCTRLALHSTQVALASAKGTGFVRPHPVQRWARQALFFLVWSCPRPAAETLVEELTP
jgi:alkylation response protein AidB-like acyl-CoA dehydrogenase